MPHSKKELWIMLMPKIGKLLITNGSRAQWMAQATEVAMPKASQFIFKTFIKTKVVLLQ